MDSLNPVDTTNFIVQNRNGETNFTTAPQANFTMNYKGTSTVSKTQLRADPQIYYTLNGVNVRYYLSKTDGPNDRGINTGDSEFL